MNNNFVESLISNHGHPRHREKLIPYQGFIGSWSFDWVGHNEDGSTWTVPGEWHFSWILEGRAIQDNWIYPKIDLRSSDDYPEGEYGTTIRFYDFEEDCIKIVYISPILSNLINKSSISSTQIVTTYCSKAVRAAELLLARITNSLPGSNCLRLIY